MENHVRQYSEQTRHIKEKRTRSNVQNIAPSFEFVYYVYYYATLVYTHFGINCKRYKSCKGDVNITLIKSLLIKTNYAGSMPEIALRFLRKKIYMLSSKVGCVSCKLLITNDYQLSNKGICTDNGKVHADIGGVLE